jgi:hypothetical protein
MQQKESVNMHVTAIAAIQSGKYVMVLSSGAPFASDEFAMQKQAEQVQEERRRSVRNLLPSDLVLNSGGKIYL